MENIDSDLNLVEDSLGMSCCPIGEVCSWVREAGSESLTDGFVDADRDPSEIQPSSRVIVELLMSTPDLLDSHWLRTECYRLAELFNRTSYPWLPAS